jgi:hypothetical protein
MTSMPRRQKVLTFLTKGAKIIAMLVQLKISDELYEKYSRRNPGNPRKALEETLEAHQDLEPGVPRLIVENPELRELKRLSGQILEDSKALLTYVRKTQAVSIGGVEVELSVGARQRLEALAASIPEPYDVFTKRRLQNAVDHVIGV